MTLPLEEARAQLVTVNAAIERIISGSLLTELIVGSGTYQRRYKYYSSEKLLENLLDLRKELLAEISTYENATPTFRTNATIPLLVGKDLFRSN